ncbi:HIT family protein [Alkalicoccus urumqiensis]|uniref:HIT family protein n=1 Tax=Alkalicoccus urumqiensis TaxID=1548213 RepID=A0A2P6MFE8_ALKUR|nr:HIT family protein [Alkalicoccus urumqiensis]PRO64987.1 HIT family protein [Alkalicoccus urumqiensis]
MSHENCIFCSIIQGDIPSAKVFENDDVYAFLDLSQVTEGHTLVIPKKHEEDIFSLQPETAASLFRHVPEIANAIDKTFSPKGLNVVNNNREYAGQSVFHYHLHLLPRHGDEDGFASKWEENGSRYSKEDLTRIAGSIAENL